MSCHSTNPHLVLCFQNFLPSPSFTQPRYLSAGLGFFEGRNKRVISFIRSVVSKSRISRDTEPFLHKIVGDDKQQNEDTLPTKDDIIKKHVNSVKSMLSLMEDGEISISAYDTAWVGLVEDINETGSPQFPSSLEWIANNQLEDGSWGYKGFFSAYDRIISTLACVVALKTWNLHPSKCDKGMRFFKDNLNKIGNESCVHMIVGFEVTFFSLLEIARSLNLQVPDVEDFPALHVIYACRDMKLSKIPSDILHNAATSLLFSLEGMAGLDWKKLMKLQSVDGSFLSSPASTAYALQQTKDPNCMLYVSRLVHRYWTEKGISWARNLAVPDLDCTAMGFRLLRLHGRKVSADVFKHFKKGDEFFCFAGQTTESVTVMYNLYRASQVALPGEKILSEAKEFSTKFLKEKQASNELLDKWIIAKDLPGEVGYALDASWYASVPRLETRFYIEQYGGEDDVWISKTLYSMPYVNNNVYLELAKRDFNNCQALHLSEWDNLQKWYGEWKLEDYGLSKKSLLMAYFVAAASIFEPERANERLAWAKTAALVDTVESFFNGETSPEVKMTFVAEFKTLSNMRDYEVARRLNKNNTAEQGIIGAMLATISQLSLGTMVLHGQDVSLSLRQSWEKWLVKWEDKGERYQDEAELLVETVNQTAGLSPGQELLSNTPEYEQLYSITNQVCNQLRSYKNHKNKDNANCRTKINTTTPEIESYMQQLVELVLVKSSDGTASLIKQTFFTIARSFYYSAYCEPEVISHHINKVLFQQAM